MISNDYNSNDITLERAALIKRVQRSLDNQELPWETEVVEDSDGDNLLPIMKETDNRENSVQQGHKERRSDASGGTTLASDAMQPRVKVSSVPNGLRAAEMVATPAETNKSISRSFKRSLRQSKITVNHESVQIVWRKPRKKQRRETEERRKERNNLKGKPPLKSLHK